MKVTVGKAGAGSPHKVKIEIWLSTSEAQIFPLGLAEMAAAVEVCLKDHALGGYLHKATRVIGDK